MLAEAEVGQIPDQKIVKNCSKIAVRQKSCCGTSGAISGGGGGLGLTGRIFQGFVKSVNLIYCRG